MAQEAANTSADALDFSSRIRPLLSDNCFKCHGPDEDAREADLRLDDAETVREYAEVISERIQSTDPDEQMPPPESNKVLSDAQVSLLEKWLSSGAPWEEHWAFEPPRDPMIPFDAADQRFAKWCFNEIDQFILKRLLDAGLEPSQDAEPLVLVRRLYLDLTGLPPTPEEADRWVERIWPGDAVEAIDEAYQQLVTSLLDSPGYGEKWARHWLDLARYADTNGYEKDRDRTIWPYRDWVIDALNADMPFDQFTIEQLAGDMLPNATQSQRVATGFHRNTMLNEEGGIDPLEFRYHAMTDRVATTGTTWLGLTLGCCQCHTHKYDPITHTEYFQIMAFLNNCDEPQLELADRNIESTWAQRRDEAEKLIELLPSKWLLDESKNGTAKSKTEGAEPNESAEDKEATRNQAIQSAFAKWLEAERDNVTTWTSLRPVKAWSNLPILTIQDDLSIFASGDTAKRDDYYVNLEPHSQPIYALQIETLPDERLPARGPGSTYYEGTLGDFYLTEIEFKSDDKVYQAKSASETFAANRYGKNPVSAELAHDGDVQTGWSVHGRQGERHLAVFVLEEPIPAGGPISVHMSFGRHFASSFGRFRIQASSDKHEPEARDYSEDVADLLRLPSKEYSDGQRSVLFRRFLLTAPKLKKHSDEIRKLQLRPAIKTTLVMAERPPGHSRETFRHHRGEYLQPREQVQAATPEVLHSMGDLPGNRLGFARWLVSDDNSLTARVVANRAWSRFFGTGIVKTIDDFGFQGQSPSHPELLDWLALRLMHTDKWSMKSFHRRIVSSRTYRQASDYEFELAETDPANRLLGRFPRVRLDAEVLRDSLLLSSGNLSRKMGGPPVRPPQPKGITEVAFGRPEWKASEGESRFRRSIYTHIKRTAPFAMYSTFDAPSGEACVANRNRSNSPLQALTVLNDEMILEFARALADAVCKHSDDDSSRLVYMFRRVLTRAPTDEETHSLIAFLKAQRSSFLKTPALAKDLLQIRATDAKDDTDDEMPMSKENLAENAAWTALARVLFGLDEALTRG